MKTILSTLFSIFATTGVTMEDSGIIQDSTFRATVADKNDACSP